MTHANLRVSGLHAPRIALVLAGITIAFSMYGCASSKDGTAALRYDDACAVMKSQIEEKQKIDKTVSTLTTAARDYRKQGDTASAVSAENRLTSLREQQRSLKDALDQSANDCRAVYGEPLPVRGPAASDPERRAPLK